MKTNGKFVIQKHTRGGDVHWDLMLEAGEALETYRLSLPPEQLTKEKSPAEKIFEHPLRFLTYEGPVNKGEGKVEIAESGTFKVIRQEQDYIEMELEGEVLKGRFALKHIRGEEFLFGANDNIEK